LNPVGLNRVAQAPSFDGAKNHESPPPGTILGLSTLKSFSDSSLSVSPLFRITLSYIGTAPDTRQNKVVLVPIAALYSLSDCVSGHGLQQELQPRRAASVSQSSKPKSKNKGFLIADRDNDIDTLSPSRYLPLR